MMLSHVQKCSMGRAKYHLINGLKTVLAKYTILSFIYWTFIRCTFLLYF